MRGLALSLGCGASLLIAAAGPALAQQPTGCSDFKWPVDRELTAFAGEGLPTLSAGAQIPGVATAAMLKLTDSGDSSFEVQPTHKPKHNPAYAGAFSLPPNTTAGSYQVTLSDDAWIDVVQGGKLLNQTGFTGSHTCSVVRKSVRFQLAAGPATVEISDSAKDALKVDVVPQPVQ